MSPGQRLSTAVRGKNFASNISAWLVVQKANAQYKMRSAVSIAAAWLVCWSAMPEWSEVPSLRLGESYVWGTEALRDGVEIEAG